MDFQGLREPRFEGVRDPEPVRFVDARRRYDPHRVPQGQAGRPVRGLFLAAVRVTTPASEWASVRAQASRSRTA